MRLQIFRVDRQHRLKTFTASSYLRCRNRMRPRSLSATRSRGYCARTLCKRCGRAVIVSVRSAVPGHRNNWRAPDSDSMPALSLALSGAFHVAFLHGAAANVDPAIGIIGVGFGNFLKCGCARLSNRPAETSRCRNRSSAAILPCAIPSSAPARAHCAPPPASETSSSATVTMGTSGIFSSFAETPCERFREHELRDRRSPGSPASGLPASGSPGKCELRAPPGKFPVTAVAHAT